jgi:hypothetical protein
MSHGPQSVFGPYVIASGASTCSEIVFDRSWKSIYLQVGTMSTGVNLNVHAKGLSTNNYYTVFHPSINSSTVTNNPFVISAGVGSGGGVVPFPNGLPNVRVVGTGVISGGCSSD